ncbi:TPA: hypothetical protein R1943_002022 [Staphylococcus delphini]|nr:hypothetical protein [Staphylococcus delphini]HEC2193209.1 hypothetical protein [Staphylococcus delphini]HEC2200966.1 hypothetical protein [Staphylococcus delphini]HEC2212813.1 hypothetical protein [Staphylococcus delphini]HEC2242884.1 hypothetical protein [Staphylococcus delphini]
MKNTHKIALQNGRELNISVEKLQAFENNQVESSEVYETFDLELYDQRNGKVSGRDQKGYVKTINQFFVEHSNVPNQRDKRKKDFVFGELHNSDASPIPREDNRGRIPSELTILFRKIILWTLFNQEITHENLTTLRWLKEFNIISDTFFKDYSRHQSNSHDYSLMDSINKELLMFDIDVLTETEKKKIVQQYYFNVVELLKNKFYTTLTKLDNDGLIFLQSFMVGAKINEEDEDKHTIEILTPSELNDLKKLETSIRDELNLHHVVGKRLYYHKKFKQELEKRLFETGLKTKGNTYNRYKFVYNTYTINKTFTDKQLLEYIKKHTYLNQTITINNQGFINDFRHYFVESVKNRINRATEKYKSGVIKKHENTIGNTSSLIDNKFSRIDMYNNYNINFTEMVLSSRHTDNLCKHFKINNEQLNPYTNESEKFELKEKDLPF